jgi:hypothetical protein
MDTTKTPSETAEQYLEHGGAVTIAPVGFRALTKVSRSLNQNKGRTRQAGERYPSGKLKVKPSIEPIAPALWDRLRTERIKAADDARFGSQVGRLSLQGELSATQAATAFRIGEIYGRFERFHRVRRSVGSPSYMVASSQYDDKDHSIEAITPEMLARSMHEELLEPEQLAELEARVEAAEKRFLKLQNFLRVFPRNVRDGLERLCVDDERVSPGMLDELAMALDEVAKFFRVKAAPKKDQHRHGPRIDKVVVNGKEHVLPDPDKEAWMKALAIVRPDLSETQRMQFYAMTAALKVRIAVARDKKMPVPKSEGVSVIDQVTRHVNNLMKQRAYPKRLSLNGFGNGDDSTAETDTVS